MNKHQIKNISNTHYKKINKYIKIIRKDFGLEAIHNLRVEYKKLRAFFRMLSFHNEGNIKINVSKKLKLYYNISGTIRDLQLQQKRVLVATKKGFKKPAAYLLYLHQEIALLKPELIKMSAEKLVPDSKKRTDALLPKKIFLSRLKMYIKQKLAALNAILLSGDFADHQIHAIRKILKDLFYTLKTFAKHVHQKLFMDILKGKTDHLFKTRLNQLGSFQDHFIAITLLKKYRGKNLNAKKSIGLDKIKKLWILGKAGIKRNLIQKLKTDFLTQNAIFNFLHDK